MIFNKAFDKESLKGVCDCAMDLIRIGVIQGIKIKPIYVDVTEIDITIVSIIGYDFLNIELKETRVLIGYDIEAIPVKPVEYITFNIEIVNVH